MLMRYEMGRGLVPPLYLTSSRCTPLFMHLRCCGMRTRIDVAVCFAVVLPSIHATDLWYGRPMMRSMGSYDGHFHRLWFESCIVRSIGGQCMQWYIESVHVAVKLEEHEGTVVLICQGENGQRH